MSMINDGGAAFPRPCSEDRKDGDQPDGNGTVSEQDGMSLRDWFAGKAMQALIASGREIDLSAHAYRLADDMVARRRCVAEPDPSDLLVALKSMRIATIDIEDDCALDAAKSVADRAIAKAEGRAK